MRRRTVLAQLAVFAAISVLIIGYTVVDLLRYDPTSTPFTVTVHLRNAGGVFTNAEVAYRGVQVGRVHAMRLETGGVRLTLALDEGTRVPDNSVAHVYDLSAVGEQYLDFTPPAHPSPTYLHGGSVVPVARTTTPVETASVIYDLERFVDSINPHDLQVIGREGAAALTGTGAQLRSILVNATTIIDQLSASEGDTLDLLHNAAILLHGAAAHAGDFDRTAHSLRRLAGTLAASTPTFEKLLAQAGPTTRLVNTLVTGNGGALTTLLANTATLTDIQVARVPGLKSLLVAVPLFGRLAPTVVHDGKLLTVIDINQNQPLCNTGLPLSNPIGGTRSKLYRVACGTGITRGAANAPRPSSAAAPASQDALALGPSAQPAATGGAQVGTYNPVSGLTTTSDGRLVRLGTNGGQDRLLGPNSWQALLLAATG